MQSNHTKCAAARPTFPTPGSPISTGLFLVRRDRIWMQRRTSSSRPMTGSSLPSRAACQSGVFVWVCLWEGEKEHVCMCVCACPHHGLWQGPACRHQQPVNRVFLCECVCGREKRSMCACVHVCVCMCVCACPHHGLWQGPACRHEQPVNRVSLWVCLWEGEKEHVCVCVCACPHHGLWQGPACHHEQPVNRVFLWVCLWEGEKEHVCVCVCVSSSRPMTGSSLPSRAACQSGVFVWVCLWEGEKEHVCMCVCVRVLITAYDRVQLAVTSSLSSGCLCECVCGREKRSMCACVCVCVCACPHHGLWQGPACRHEQPVNRVFLWVCLWEGEKEHVCVCVSSSRPMTGSSLPSRAACQSGVFVSVFVGGRKGACVCVCVSSSRPMTVQLAITSSLSMSCFCGRNREHVCVVKLLGHKLYSPACHGG